MKKCLLLMFSVIGCYLQGQEIFKGTVKSKLTGEALLGATIYFPDLKNGTVSDENGQFSINDLPQTKALVQVKLLGYKTLIQQINIKETTEKEFILEESVLEANEVVVTGVSKATEIKRNPVPMTFVDSKYLERNSASNIIDALNKVPGINSISTGPNVAKPVIRGLGYNRILTMFDGIRQEGQQWGDEHGVEIDQFLIDRVEVVKGPASLIYGSDALAGVVNLLPAIPAPAGMIRGSLMTQYQTNNDEWASSIAFDGNTQGFTWGFRGSLKEAADFRNKADGKVFNTGYREQDLSAHLGINRKWGYSTLNFSIYDNQQEIPDGSRDSTTRKFTRQITESDSIRPVVSNSELNSYKINPIHQFIRHYRLYSTTNLILGQSKLFMKFGFQKNIRKEFAHPEHPGLAGLSLDLNTITYDLRYYFPDFKGWEATIGSNGMYGENRFGKGTDFLVPEYKLIDIGPFAYLRKNVGKVDFAFGVRYDSRSFENSELYLAVDPITGFDMKVKDSTGAVKRFNYYNHTYSGLSGSFGMTYNVTEGLLIKGNLARGYRSPNITEISAKGVHPGTGFQQLGDENFKPEFSLQEDLGIFFDSEHISAGIEIFHNRIDNYIFNQKLSGINGGDSIYSEGGNDYPVFKFRQTKAQLYGGEFKIDIHPHPLDWLHFENSMSFVNAQNLGGNGAVINDENRYLPFIPPLHTNSELHADFNLKGRLSNIFFKAGFQYYAAQKRFLAAEDTETETPAYGLVDAGAGVTLKDIKGRTIFILGIFGNNLTDVIYQSNMSRMKYMEDYPKNHTGRSGIYNMGRNISFRLTIPFDMKI
jgi:iron complex outermembrane recepter protein